MRSSLECFVTLGDNPVYAHGLICRSPFRLPVAVTCASTVGPALGDGISLVPLSRTAGLGHVSLVLAEVRPYVYCLVSGKFLAVRGHECRLRAGEGRKRAPFAFRSKDHLLSFATSSFAVLSCIRGPRSTLVHRDN